MKKTLNYLVIAGSCLLGACTQADIPVPDGPDPGPSQSTTTRVKLADALKNADRLLELIKGPATRARTVKSVEMFGGDETRSGESETSITWSTMITMGALRFLPRTTDCVRSMRYPIKVIST